MIAVAVIAMISPIAILSYQSYMTDNYRNQAVADGKVERDLSEYFTCVVDDGDYTGHAGTIVSLQSTNQVMGFAAGYRIVVGDPGNCSGAVR